jgi:hypothetical protein
MVEQMAEWVNDTDLQLLSDMSRSGYVADQASLNGLSSRYALRHHHDLSRLLR